MPFDDSYVKQHTRQPPLAATARTGTAIVRVLAAPIWTWFANRRRSTRDLQELANMGDRELLDIGISRASVRAVAEGNWRRDWPR